MSSPMIINRSASPSAQSESASSSYSSSSASSGSSTQSLTYTRDELLALATSPLSNGPAPAALKSFPEIRRRAPRGLIEAYNVLEYSRGHIPEPNDTSAKSVARERSPKRTQSPPSEPPRRPAIQSQPVLEVPPVWKVGVYVPPARRFALEQQQQQQRVKPGRGAVKQSKFLRRPGQPRAIQVQGRW
ncbi:hypothetical protein BU17DRAFT_84875 [Hysterangium stoloniferum]|nr:hypothetical protein BU17DRAFT_84875 [Hysterangium stoloniferum]